MNAAARPRLIVVAGPTAAGKSALALHLATELDAELLIADSRQVYRGMDVGTAKATRAERARVVHHGIDLVEPGHHFDASVFHQHAHQVVASAQQRGVPIVVEGGTGLYLRTLMGGLMDAPPRDEAFRAALRAEAVTAGWPALHARLRSIDPAYAARIAPTDPVRIIRALEVHHVTGAAFSVLEQGHAFKERAFEALGFLVTPDAAQHRQNVETRVAWMWTHGLLDETSALLKLLGEEHSLLGTINYAQARDHLLRGVPSSEAQADMALRTRQFAKRQRTWFRREAWLVPVLPTDSAQLLQRSRAFLAAPGAGTE